MCNLFHCTSHACALAHLWYWETEEQCKGSSVIHFHTCASCNCALCTMWFVINLVMSFKLLILSEILWGCAMQIKELKGVVICSPSVGGGGKPIWLVVALKNRWQCSSMGKLSTVCSPMSLVHADVICDSGKFSLLLSRAQGIGVKAWNQALNRSVPSAITFLPKEICKRRNRLI